MSEVQLFTGGTEVELLQAITTADGRWVIITGAVAIGDDTTLPVGSNVMVSPTGLITVASGKTFAIEGVFRCGFTQCFSVTSTVVFGSGSVSEIYPEWWGATGDDEDSDTPAMQAAFGVMQSGTAGGVFNPRIFLSKLNYDVNDTIATTNSASHFEVAGLGRRRCRLTYVGTSGEPVIKLTNARNVRFRDFGIFADSTHKPSYCVQVHRAAGLVGGAAPMHCSFKELFCGGDGANAGDNGIGFTCDDGFDANNEQSITADCEFYNLDVAAVAFEHENSLWHVVERCYASACAKMVSNIASGSTAYMGPGGGFTSRSNRSTLITDEAYYLGSSLKPILIDDHQSESDESLIVTNAEAGTLSYVVRGGKFGGGAPGNVVVDCKDGLDVYAKFDNFVSLTPNGAQYWFRDATGVVEFNGVLETQIKQIHANCRVYFDQKKNVSTIDDFYNLGSGSFIDLSSKYIDTTYTQAVVSGALEVYPSTKMIVIPAGSAATITAINGGYPGQIVSVRCASNNNTFDKSYFFLKGNVDATPDAASVLLLQKCHASLGFTWQEVGRSF